ncbi:rhodanese-like domain-containing protein [Planctomycetota bacterium]
MSNERNVHGGWLSVLITCVVICVVGCGTNKFEQEVTIEDSSVKFAREAMSGQYAIVSTAEVKKLRDDGADFFLLDAMPAATSFDLAHIPGAANFEFPKGPIDKWDEESMPGRTKEGYRQLLGDDLDRLIIVYCGFVKCARSHNAAVFARELGYTNVKRYAGGIYAWRGAGLAVESK